VVKFKTGQVLVMPWLKVNDQQHCNPKVIRAWMANPGAMGLWLMAASWSADNMTDGFVPVDVVAFMRGDEFAEVLVGCGLWEAVEGGFQISGFLDHNPSKADSLQKAKAKAKAGSKGGQVTARRKGSGKAERDSERLAALQRLMEPEANGAAGAAAGAGVVLDDGVQQTSSPNPNPNPNPSALTEQRKPRAIVSEKSLRNRERLQRGGVVVDADSVLGGFGDVR
jgi:hypothetical protein